MLILCPECELQVSTAAPSCPGCGHPIAAASAEMETVCPGEPEQVSAAAQTASRRVAVGRPDELGLPRVSMPVQCATPPTSRPVRPRRKATLAVGPGQLKTNQDARPMDVDSEPATDEDREIQAWIGGLGRLLIGLVAIVVIAVMVSSGEYRLRFSGVATLAALLGLRRLVRS